MAEQEQSDSRTEEPTPRRRQKAREEGRVAKSPEFAAAAMLLTGTVLLASTAGRRIAHELERLFETGPSWIGALACGSEVRITDLLISVSPRVSKYNHAKLIGESAIQIGI